MNKTAENSLVGLFFSRLAALHTSAARVVIKALIALTTVSGPMAVAQVIPPNAVPGKSAPAAKPKIIVPPSQAARYRFEKENQGQATPDGQNAALRKLIERVFRANRAPLPEELQASYHGLWEMIGDHYYDTKRLVNWERRRIPEKPIENLADFDAAVEALFASLEDRWTSYHGKSSIAHQKAKRAQGIHSLGLSLKLDDSKGYRVASIVFGSPAHRTRIRPQDEIVSVGQTVLRGLAKKEADALLEGKDGTEISVRIRHRLEDDSGQIFEEEIEESVRLTVKPTPEAEFQAEILPGGIAYVRLPDFMSPATDAQLELAFLALMKRISVEQITGLILDLRGNPGGRFEMALAVASLFLEGSEEATPGNIGVICTATTRDDRSVSDQRHRVIKRLPHLENAGDAEARTLLRMLQTKPLVVLVDKSSASCAEIVAGGLRDNKRAIATVGEPTYGKSVGFQITETPWGGRFSLTTLEYLTPAGHDVAREGGVQPTVLKRQPRSAKIDEQLAEAVAILARLNSEPIYNEAPDVAQYDGLLRYRWSIGSGAGAIVLAFILVVRRGRPRQEEDTTH